MTAEPQLTVILGRCDDMRAEVYLRVTGLPAAAEIAGTLTGPQSRFAITLPSDARFIDLGPTADGTSVVARAILTEPSYWTPDLPSLYRLHAVVSSAGRTILSCDRRVGLRRLGVRGRSFWLEGRRWVPRGVPCDPAAFDPGPLRESLAAAVIDAPADDVCEAADDWGVGIVARCRLDPLAACRRWAVHPSVMLSVLPRHLTADQAAAIIAAIRSEKGTLLVGLEVDATEPPPRLPVGIEFLVVALPTQGLPHDAWREAPPELPLVAMRPAGGRAGDQRRACDLLQADLAAWRGNAAVAWDWAGYLVS